jgi:hypothetical protein
VIYQVMTQTLPWPKKKHIQEATITNLTCICKWVCPYVLSFHVKLNVFSCFLQSNEKTDSFLWLSFILYYILS